MGCLIFLRHGTSRFNEEARFTGWMDIDLTKKGINEAINAGKTIRSKGIQIDLAFTSALKRAIRTLWIVLDETDRMWIPIESSWRLNERRYGDLEGRFKSEMDEKYGKDTVSHWRKSYRGRPPAHKEADPRNPRFDARYKSLHYSEIPLTESLEDAQIRVLPLWQNRILPELESGLNVLVVAHGNIIRSLIMHIQNISEEQIENVTIPAATPIVYGLDESFNQGKHLFL